MLDLEAPLNANSPARIAFVAIAELTLDPILPANFLLAPGVGTSNAAFAAVPAIILPATLRVIVAPPTAETPAKAIIEPLRRSKTPIRDIIGAISVPIWVMPIWNVIQNFINPGAAL